MLVAPPVVLVALGVGRCGASGDLPPGALATVAGTTIGRSTFDHWLAVTAREQARADREPISAVPDPPAYRGCVAALRWQRLPAGKRKPSAAALKVRCEQQYHALKTQLMEFLVQGQWLLGEGRSLGVTVTPAAVRRRVDADIKREYPRRSDFARFTRATGITMQDPSLRVKLTALDQAVVNRLGANVKVTAAQVAAYYNRHRQSVGRPERSELLDKLARTKAKAQLARQAIERGAAWKAVARKYSTLRASSAQPTEPTAAANGQREPAVERAIFAGKQGQLQGPIDAPAGYLVFEVTSVTPASKPTRAQARDQIVKQLRVRQTLIAATSYQHRYRSETTCTKGFVMPAVCGNAPKPSTRTTGADRAAYCVDFGIRHTTVYNGRN